MMLEYDSDHQLLFGQNQQALCFFVMRSASVLVLASSVFVSFFCAVGAVYNNNNDNM